MQGLSIPTVLMTAILFYPWSVPSRAATTKPTTFPDPNANAVAYLNDLEKKSQEREGGVRIRFTGNFKPPPADTAVGLKETFPRHRFLPVAMEYLHWGYDPVTLLLITDADTNEVVFNYWDMWFCGTDEKFKGFLKLYPPRDRKHASQMVGELAGIITWMCGGRADEVKDDGKILKVGLRNRHGYVWRILEVPLGSDLKFDAMRFINPGSEKAD